MATMLEIIKRAHKKLGILARDTELTAAEASDGLEALNGMLHEWKLRGVDLEYTSLAANATFPIGPEFEDGTTYMLAMRISPDFMVPPSFDADDFFRAIQAAYATIPLITLDAAVVEVPSKRARDETLGFEWNS